MSEHASVTDRERHVQRALAAARSTEPIAHAYAEVYADAALARARTPGPATGGDWMVVGVKDTIEISEGPVRAGGPVPLSAGGSDARAVALLRAAGATVLGRQHCHLFGLGLDTPPTRNAWDPRRYPGGSSAGAGVSVALGSATVALGTDAAGSIRKPASLNGVVGYRPTPGLVPGDGIVPGPSRHNQIGWVTRTVAQAREVARALGMNTQTPPLRRPVRVAVLAGAVGASVEPDVARVLSSALQRVADAGHRVDEVPFRDHDEAAAAFAALLAAETAAAHSRLLERIPAYPAWVSELFNHPLEAAALARASRTVGRARRALADAAAGFDVLATPTVELAPLPVEEMTRADGLVDPAILARYCRWTSLASLAGLPAVSIPAGLDEAGLPVGLQLIGRAGHDASLLDTAGVLAGLLGFSARPAMPQPAGTERKGNPHLP
jgi:aspartyl-tRNA(Asn)/glutamyl-tRNA(Gln) amidotransferase subunit A